LFLHCQNGIPCKTDPKMTTCASFLTSSGFAMVQRRFLIPQGGKTYRRRGDLGVESAIALAK
jgi:hypothetical protein